MGLALVIFSHVLQKKEERKKKTKETHKLMFDFLENINQVKRAEVAALTP